MMIDRRHVIGVGLLAGLLFLAGPAQGQTITPRVPAASSDLKWTGTRFYIQNADASYDPATERGAWNNTSYGTAKKLSTTKFGAIASRNYYESTTTNAWDALLIKAVSDPIPTAQTIGGTLTWVLGSRQSHQDLNAHWHVHVFVTIGDSNNVRGTLFTNYTEAVGVNEWPITDEGDSHNGGPDTALTISTPLAILAGDRIVIEVGFVARNTTATGYTGYLYYGGDDATDLTMGGDETTNPGWFEFSANLFPNPLTIDKPAATEPGDVMIASIGARPVYDPAVTVITPPDASWTLVRRVNDTGAGWNSLAIYRKVAGISEPATYDWTILNHHSAVGGIQSFAGVDTGNPIDVENGWYNASATSHLTPSGVSTTVANAMLVTSFVNGQGGNVWSVVSPGLTEGFDQNQQNFGGSALMSAYGVQAVAGATTQKQADTSRDPAYGSTVNPDQAITHILALRPYICPGVWCYVTGAASLAPPALDPWSNMVLLGSNDEKAHSMADANGVRPVGFTPYLTGGPIQSRAAVLPAGLSTTGLNIAYLTSQDGCAYAVDTSTGSKVWPATASCTAPLGDTLQGGAGVWVQAGQALTFTGGVTSDVVFVGTSNTAGSFLTNNKVYALNGNTGATVWTFSPGNMDIISSTPHVDYANEAVWVTSRSNSSTQPSVWKINAKTGALIATWSLDQSSTALGDIDGTPVPNADFQYVYVGTNAGKLNAILSSTLTNNANIITHTPSSGTGAINGMPWSLSYVPVGPATQDTIIFTRKTTIHSVNFDGSSFTVTTPTPNWTTTLVGAPLVSAPVDDSAGRLYVGASDGKVHQIDVATGADQAQATISASGFDKGFNFRQTFNYVTTDAANETYVIGDTHPISRNGVTFGWLDAISSANINATVDRRFAGSSYVVNTTGCGIKRFRVDLPATGTYSISLALGFQSTATNSNTLEIRDNTTVLTTISGNTAAGSFLDATGVSRTIANWPSQNVAIQQTFATTTFIAALGRAVCGTGDYSAIAHLRIVQLGTVGDPTFNADLSQIHVGATDGRIYTFSTPF